MSTTSTLMSYLFEKLKRRSSSSSSSSSSASSAAAAAALVGNNKDVVGEILSRLPMSSVIRFRLVCKQWRLLTSTQSFLEMHDACSCSHDDNNNSSCCCFVVQHFDNCTDEVTSKSDHFNILFFNIDTQLSAAATNNNNKMMKKKKKKNKRLEMVREYIDLSRFTSRGGGGGSEYAAAAAKRKYYHIKLISSYRGFLLFNAKPTSNKFKSRLQTKKEVEEEVKALIFYNPVTKEQLTVTAPSSVVYCGFYYHSPTKEYRILYQRIFDPHHHEYQADGVAKFQVLGLQTKIMRNLMAPSNSPEYSYYPDHSTPPVISNGSLHWIVSEDDRHGHLLQLPSCSHTILSFGMESEKFRTMPHPTLSHPCSPGSTDGHSHTMNLLEMEGGILCLCDYWYFKLKIYKLEIYVMKDYKKWTWVRRYRIDLGDVCTRFPSRNNHLLYKALQVRQGVILIRYYEEYILYPLNQRQEDDDPRPSSSKSNIKKKIVLEEQLECTFAAADKEKKRQRFQVEIDQYWTNKLGRLRRMIIKHPKLPITKKQIRNGENPLALVRNPVVLTPSLASLQHHKSTGTSNIGGDGGGGGGNCILSLKYENHNTTTLTEYYVQRS